MIDENVLKHSSWLYQLDYRWTHSTECIEKSNRPKDLWRMPEGVIAKGISELGVGLKWCYLKCKQTNFQWIANLELCSLIFYCNLAALQTIPSKEISFGWPNYALFFVCNLIVHLSWYLLQEMFIIFLHMQFFFALHFPGLNFFLLSATFSESRLKKIRSQKKTVLQLKTLRNLNLHLNVIYLQSEHMVFIEFKKQCVGVLLVCSLRTCSFIFSGKFSSTMLFFFRVATRTMWQRSEFFFVSFDRRFLIAAVNPYHSRENCGVGHRSLELSVKSILMCRKKVCIASTAKTAPRANDDDGKLRLHRRTNATYAMRYRVGESEFSLVPLFTTKFQIKVIKYCLFLPWTVVSEKRTERVFNFCMIHSLKTMERKSTTNFVVFAYHCERNRLAQRQIYPNDGFVYFTSLTPLFVNDKHSRHIGFRFRYCPKVLYETTEKEAHNIYKSRFTKFWQITSTRTLFRITTWERWMLFILIFWWKSFAYFLQVFFVFFFFVSTTKFVKPNKLLCIGILISGLISNVRTLLPIRNLKQWKSNETIPKR